MTDTAIDPDTQNNAPNTADDTFKDSDRVGPANLPSIQAPSAPPGLRATPSPSTLNAQPYAPPMNYPGMGKSGTDLNGQNINYRQDAQKNLNNYQDAEFEKWYSAQQAQLSQPTAESPPAPPGAAPLGSSLAEANGTAVPAPPGNTATMNLDAIGKRFGIERGVQSGLGEQPHTLPDADYAQKIHDTLKQQYARGQIEDLSKDPHYQALQQHLQDVNDARMALVPVPAYLASKGLQQQQEQQQATQNDLLQQKINRPLALQQQKDAAAGTRTTDIDNTRRDIATGNNQTKTDIATGRNTRITDEGAANRASRADALRQTLTERSDELHEKEKTQGLNEQEKNELEVTNQGIRAADTLIKSYGVSPDSKKKAEKVLGGAVEKASPKPASDSDRTAPPNPAAAPTPNAQSALPPGLAPHPHQPGMFIHQNGGKYAMVPGGFQLVGTA